MAILDIEDIDLSFGAITTNISISWGTDDLPLGDPLKRKLRFISYDEERKLASKIKYIQLTDHFKDAIKEILSEHWPGVRVISVHTCGNAFDSDYGGERGLVNMQIDCKVYDNNTATFDIDFIVTDVPLFEYYMGIRLMRHGMPGHF